MEPAPREVPPAEPGLIKPRPYRPHRCQPPERGHRGQRFECWCGRHWVAAAGVTVRGNRITSLRPDWRFEPPPARSADRGHAVNRERVRHWAGETWYYGRLWVLGLAAVMIVCWMASAILLANFPRLAGTVHGPRIEQSQDHTVGSLNPEEQRERWGTMGADGDRRGLTPYEQWKGKRPLNPPTEERHQERGRRATQPAPSVPAPTAAVSADAPRSP